MLALVLTATLLLFAFLYWRQRRLTATERHARANAEQKERAAVEWLAKIEREHEARRRAICEVITRRPPRRHWLRTAYKVARLAQ